MAEYTLPELRYDHGALEPHLSARILELHHGAHHRAYVTGLNATLDRLAEAREADDHTGLVGLERTFAFNLAGHVLHSIYWECLHPDGGGRPGGELLAAITDGFGSYEAFERHLSQATITAQGSGWGALSWEPVGGRLVVEQIHDHHANTGQSTVPLLVVDAWEHAYYLQYENRRADYVSAIWSVIDWPSIAARFDHAVRAGGPLAG